MSLRSSYPKNSTSYTVVPNLAANPPSPSTIPMQGSPGSVVYSTKRKQASQEEEDDLLLDEEGYQVEYHLKPKQIRAKTLFHAQLSEEIQDYESLKLHVLQLIQTSVQLSDSERKLFLLAFKNCVGARRKAWRNLVQQERTMESSNALLPHLRLYRSEVELEIEQVCQEMLAAINKLLNVPKGVLNTNEMVFYYKLQGDYWRYLCEFRQGDQLEISSNEALKAYNDARDVVRGPLGLVPADPQRLGLALNMSVFHYEILGNREEGLSLCRDVYESANYYLNQEEDNQLDSFLIKNAKDVLQLLQDNLDLWEKEQAAGGGIGRGR